ncbi:IS66 family insertion sequence element accessory protein TnpB [Parabacteroides sp. ZJ-118]|uniref:IS66 family insertion sequence element accessory protein TnpB n=1 Tax=Parabacteroides sp. ZJ-118 TaxID=2709398 RepID=UPI0013EB0168
MSSGCAWTLTEVFVFLGKNGRTVKMLHREGRGITLYTRKLDKGRFHAPRILADGKSCQFICVIR